MGPSRQPFSQSVSHRPVSGALALMATLAATALGLAQLSPDSWWPKFQRDAQNTGRVPLVGLAGDAHVVWSVRLSDPIVSENHATPVFSPDNCRLYVGGPASTLTAVDAASGSVAWTLMLGDGTGAILHTAVVGDDGSVYVGVWDNHAPPDGFSKVHDEGNYASVVWTFPMQRLLASPTITAAGLIIVGGQHESDGWGYFALEDLGEDYAVAWVAGQLADPGDPSSTGAIGSSPALSADGTWVLGGSYENATFWQIDAQTGFEAARLPLDFYCYAPSPVASDDSFAFVGEGLSFSAPDDETQGKLYVFEPDQQGTLALLDSLPLEAGHLNSGTAALKRRADGGLRLYVPANGLGHTSASLVAVDFEPDAPYLDPPQPALVKRWQTALGDSAMAYSQAVVTDDDVIYVLGPADHRLYAVRGGDDQAVSLWSLALADITRVADWNPARQRGPQGVVVGPDGTLYWNAVDGYLYALHGWLSGDLDADGQLTVQDLLYLVTALVNPEQYEQQFPEIDADTTADLNGDGRLDFFDISRMIELLAGP